MKKRKKKNPLECIIESCQLISSTLDLEEVLRCVTSMSSDILGAEAGSLMLMDDSGKKLDFAVAIGAKGKQLEEGFSLELGQGIAGWAAEKGEPVIVPDVSKDKRFFGKPDKQTGFQTHSILAVPLKIKDRIIGVLEAVNSRQGPSFGEQDVPLFQAFASQVAIAVENARMHQRILKQQKLEQELAVASEIQGFILPPKEHKIGRFSISAEYIPARKIGGDFFDVITTNSGKIIVAIGDVSGKSIPAALYMMRVITFLRVIAEKEADITEIAFRLNNRLCRRPSRGMFATAILILIDTAGETLSMVNAGHPAPIEVNKKGVRYLQESSLNIPVGITANTKYRKITMDIKKGSSFFLYTDGIIEARNGKGEEFGAGKLIKQFRVGEDDEEKDVLKKVFAEVEKFTRQTPQHDDLSALLIKAE